MKLIMENAVEIPHSYFYWVVVLVILCIIAFSVALFWYIRYCRRQPRYDYTALEDDALLHDRMEMDRKLHRDSDRNMAMIQCQYYLRNSGRYIFIQQLSDIGSRIDKHWFMVRDTETKTERLLTMTHVVENCPIRYAAASRPVLLELLLAIQHPYIYPVLDIDRKVITEQEFIITVIPFNEKGSLRDLIYHTQCHDDWKIKCRHRGSGLELAHIQRLGSQILEAMLFLKDQSFPPFIHLHTGNIILQNGAARISGLENVLLGYISQHYQLPKKIYNNKEATEVVCFGHLLFEMATGYELCTSFPNGSHYSDLEDLPQVIEVLTFIFEQGHNIYPTLRQVSNLEFFRYIDLRELRCHVPVPVFHTNLTREAKCLLREIKRHHKPKRKGKRSQSLTTLETTSVDSRESRESAEVTRIVRKKKKRTLSSSETTPEQLCTQMQTLPLEDIEGSTSLPPQESNTYGRQIDQKSADMHSRLLQEIQSGLRLKHVLNKTALA